MNGNFITETTVSLFSRI